MLQPPQGSLITSHLTSSPSVFLLSEVAITWDCQIYHPSPLLPFVHHLDILLWATGSTTDSTAADLAHINITSSISFFFCKITQFYLTDLDLFPLSVFPLRAQAIQFPPSNPILCSCNNYFHVLYHDTHKSPLWSFSGPPVCSSSLSTHLLSLLSTWPNQGLSDFLLNICHVLSLWCTHSSYAPASLPKRTPTFPYLWPPPLFPVFSSVVLSLTTMFFLNSQ